MMRRMWRGRSLAFSVIVVVACSGESNNGTPPDDGGVTTAHCAYDDIPPTAGAGGTVTAGALEAGTAEAVMNAPVTSALGAYTARAGFSGSAGTVDNRKSAMSSTFNPSIGVETAPRVRALALSAGGETVVLMKLDIGAVFEDMIFELERRLSLPGKVLIAASHTHSGWGHFTAHSAYQVGFGVFRRDAYDALVEQLEDVARAALDARRPAKIGFHADLSWDRDDRVTRDRRSTNDELMGGPRKDDAFFLMRVDGTDDRPMAVVPIYGIHGTLHSENNSLASTDATGGMERVLEEMYDDEVLVMHLQGAAADVSPTPWGGINCSIKPGNDRDPCFQWLRAEAHGLVAAPLVHAAWVSAGDDMETSVAMEMLTRSIELGPYHDTFTIRDGALEYAPFDDERKADRDIFHPDGSIISPIDEFNAPVGAGLCENEMVNFGAGTMPGTDDLYPYGSCAKVGAMSDIFEILLDTKFESDNTHPMCQSTRTTISALRIGEYVFGTIPGEPAIMLADYLRDNSPVAADKTIVLGYAQGHGGYLLTPEDWIAGGYESSINIWGPLEGEYVGERLLELLPMAVSPEREDASTISTDRWLAPTATEELPVDDPSPMAGTVPATVPDNVWLRTGPAASAQPPATVPRVSGVATFVWIGDDPLVATPVVSLERETAPDTWQPVTRRSGRLVRDGALVTGYTPLPIRREDDQPQTHYWYVEFQAVPWLGATDDGGADIDTLATRAALPLGRYRFRVAGKDFDITSDAFEVVPAPLTVNAARTGTSIAANASLHAPDGYRLLDLILDSNDPVPVRGGTFDVELTLAGGDTLRFDAAVADDDGTVTVDAGASADQVTRVRITDPWGNTQTAAVD